MTCDELNEFIKNYMENDKTGTAIMLTAPWGFGKSYYVQNFLKPFLEKDSYKCVVVSVYGLRSIRDISKQIYLNLRTIKVLRDNGNKSEIFSTSKAVGKTIGKTLLNAVATGIGFDITAGI